ncbi:hypothetical protein AVEN_57925-1 [Araneus ventricosus]|uniref:Uncharacterized protein n=1 Tax=Araneus ventricosus TaxID=182803 RepID=A0A4Y2KIN7_ARAVE|nr:hypothetical protein AVEN_57925-1 [Araneus ventricosus]
MIFLNSIFRGKSLTKCHADLKKKEHLYISDEFQALPSINSFPSKPIRDLSYSSKNLVCCLLTLSHPTTEPSTSEIQNHRGRTGCLDTDRLHLKRDERKCTPSEEVALTSSKVDRSGLTARRWNTDVDQFKLKVLQENNLSPYTNVQVGFLLQMIPRFFKVASSSEKKLPSFEFGFVEQEP